MKTSMKNHNKVITEEEKQRLAYNLWERAHRPEGQALDFWVEAERQLATAARANPKAATAAKKAKRPVRSA